MTRIPFLLLLAGCGPSFVSDKGELGFRSEDVVSFGDGADPNPILSGSVICPTVTCEGDSCPPLPRVDSCYDRHVSGAATLRANGCIAFTGVGPAELRLTPQREPCDLPNYTPMPDAVQFNVIRSIGVRGVAVQPEQVAMDAGFVGGLAEPLPADWLNPEGEAFHVVEGGRFMLSPRLVRGEEQQVAWTKSRATATFDDSSTRPLARAAFVEDGRIEVIAADSTDGTVSLRIGTRDFPVADIIGESRHAPESMEIVVAYWPDLNGQTTPIAARAVLRDAKGDLLYGAPVTWRLRDGDLLLRDGVKAGLPGQDYVRLADVCRSERDGEGRATLVASYGDLTDSVDLWWTTPPRAGEPPADCAHGSTIAIGPVGLSPIGERPPVNE